MKSLNMILLINIFIFGISGNYVVNRNDWHKHNLHRRKHTRKERKTRLQRSLQNGSGLIQGNVIGAGLGVAGTTLALIGNDENKKQLRHSFTSENSILQSASFISAKQRFVQGHG